MTARYLEVRRGMYRDSVRLMQVSRAVQGVPGVSAVLVAMATELNLDLAAGMGFTPSGAAPNDLLVAVAAVDEAALAAALDRLEAELDEPTATGPAGQASPADAPPRTAGAAVRRAGADLVLVSTPGRYAFLDAMDALDAGASVLVFSDNVAVEQEIRLKEAATERGLLVMGPDCGTAMVSGIGLGFANVVQPGPVGLVAASGTGAQQVSCLLDAAGVGVSHVLGVGGRDLSEAVGGLATLDALVALDADPATELIVVVSKPPAPEVAEKVRAHAAGLATPVLFALLGLNRSGSQPDLTATVEDALRRLGRPAPARWPVWLPPSPPAPRPGALRGLFSGGTLCDEAMVIASAALGPIRSNIPLRPEWTLDVDRSAPTEGPGASKNSSPHEMIDFGDDELTRGRPHPMIDGSLRLERFASAAADPSCAVILLDVVLGYVADADPAATLAPAVAAARDRGVAVVVSLIGTLGDPQGLHRQAEALRDAGAAVFASNAGAARYAVGLIEGAT
jgi:FdrA protein